MGATAPTGETEVYSPTARPLWKRLVRRVGKRYLRWKYSGFTPDSEPDKSVRIAGLRLAVLRGVFDPALHFTSGVFAQFLRRPGVIDSSNEVLDLGTGSGALAVTAALAGAGRVVATDINPDAVRTARVN